MLFLVLLFVGWGIAGEPPGGDEDVQEIVEHYVDNEDSVLIGAWLTGLAAVALVFFAGYSPGLARMGGDRPRAYRDDPARVRGRDRRRGLDPGRQRAAGGERDA
ncbi:MAG: hypothetical protein ACRDKH_02460 [Solirubrobacterales bacterium]